MDVTFSALSFLATVPGILLISAVAAVMILLWDWRSSLLGLFFIQLGVATIAVNVLQVDVGWATVQTATMLICCLILGISAWQMPAGSSWHQSGSMLLRVLVLLLLYVCWRLFEFNITIPLIRPDVTVLFVWLGICALLTLSLNDNALFTGTALLQWTIPAQVITAVLLPIPNLIVMLGVLQLLLALGCSYLVLVEYFGYAEKPKVATDMTFAWPQLPAPRQGSFGSGLMGLPEESLASRGGRAVPALPAVSSAAQNVHAPSNPSRTSTGLRPVQSPPKQSDSSAPSERTGEHPLIRLGRRKSSGKRSDRPSSTGNSPSSPNVGRPSESASS